MKKVVVVFLSILVKWSVLLAQPINFLIGYQASTLLTPSRYFQVIDYEYQIQYGITKKGFRLSPLFDGISYGLYIQALDNFGINVIHYRKVSTSNVAEFPNNEFAQYKMILKSWGVGCTFREENPKFGVDFEFGQLTLKKKKYPEAEFKKGKWVDYCPTVDFLGKGPIYFGMNIYLMYRWKFIELRPYLSWIPGVVQYPDYSGINTSYYTFKLSTIGLATYLVLGNKND
jgi:hypothetical protein